MKFHPVGLHMNGYIGNQGTSTAPQDNKWTIPSGSDWLGAQSVGTVPNFYTRSMSLPFMPNASNQMQPPSAIQPISASPNPQFASITQCPPPCGMAGLVQVINEEGEYGYLSEEELKNLDIELYRSLKINPNYYELNTSDGEKIQGFIDSMSQTNTAKIYEFEEKLIQKDTIGAIDKITEFQPTSEMESFHKTTKEIYSHSWLINKSSLSIDDSLALYSIAYQSPRVSGNAVYQARAMLGLIILDTETYSAKSAQVTNAVIIESERLLKLYPNPTNNIIKYEFEIEEKDKGNIKIYSVLGYALEEINVNHKVSKGSININGFSKGIYFFELNIEGKQKITKQFIVN